MRIFVSAVALTLLLVVAGAVATSQDADLDAERLAGEAAANAAREAAEADPEVQEMRRMMDQILGDEGEAAAAAAASDDGTIEEQAKRKLNPEEYEMYKVAEAIMKPHKMPELVGVLTEGKHDVNVRTDEGITPLMFAAMGGSLEIVNLLLTHGAQVNVKTEAGATALMLSLTQKPNVHVTAALLKAGADINAQSKDGTTALIIASLLGLTDAVQVLLDAGADPILPAHQPLNAAIDGGHEQVVELLLKAGADPDGGSVPQPDLMHPLLLAARKDEKRMVEALYKAGADVNVEDADGWTPAFVALSRGDASMLSYFIMHGADLEHRMRDGGNVMYAAVAMHLAAQEAKKGGKDEAELTEDTQNFIAHETPIFDLLMKHHADVNALNPVTKKSALDLLTAHSDNAKLKRALTEYGKQLEADVAAGKIPRPAPKPKKEKTKAAAPAASAASAAPSKDEL